MHQPDAPAMAGNLSTSLRWGGVADSLALTMQHPFDADDDDGPEPSRRRSSGGGKKGKTSRPRQSSGEAYNSRANYFCQLTPWNKIEILAELEPQAFGVIYASTFTIDQLDSAIFVATGKTPSDKLMYRNKAATHQAPCQALALALAWPLWLLSTRLFGLLGGLQGGTKFP